MPGDLRRIFERIGALKAHIKFLLRCSKHKIVPKGLISKPRIYTTKSQKLEERLARIRMRELLNSLHAKLFKLVLAAETYPEKEGYEFTIEQLKQIQNAEYFRRSKIQAKKFMILRSKQKKLATGKIYKMDAVVNLSKDPLTEDQARVLARGFKFRPTLNELPLEQFAMETERVIKGTKMDPGTAALLRSSVLIEMQRMKEFGKRKPTKSNLLKADWVAIKQLKSDTERIIIPADKGDRTIRMDFAYDEKITEYGDDEENFGASVVESKSYLTKMKERIKTHQQLNYDPAPIHEKKLNAALLRMK